MSGIYLLDSNALIALNLNHHEYHQRVAAWAAGADRIALFPIVEGALVRFLVRGGGPLVAHLRPRVIVVAHDWTFAG